jgi:hypothetical protein
VQTVDTALYVSDYLFRAWKCAMPGLIRRLTGLNVFAPEGLCHYVSDYLFRARKCAMPGLIRRLACGWIPGLDTNQSAA